MSESPSVSVVIFAARESVEVLTQSLNAAITASKNLNARISLLINGNASLAEAMARVIASDFPDRDIDVWRFDLGDKANCFNQYFYTIRPKGALSIFIDGYVRVLPDSLEKMFAHEQQHHPMAMTGVPTRGRSAAKLRKIMLEQGGIHGNLFALSALAIDKLVDKGFRVPLGIYRTDPLIGAVISFNFSPADYAFDQKRVHVLGDVSWDLDTHSVFSVSDVKKQLMRMMRQGKGEIENRAVRNKLRDQKIEVGKLPDVAYTLCKEYLNQHPVSLKEKVLDIPFWLAVNKLVNSDDEAQWQRASEQADKFEKVVL